MEELSQGSEYDNVDTFASRLCMAFICIVHVVAALKCLDLSSMDIFRVDVDDTLKRGELYAIARWFPFG